MLVSNVDAAHHMARRCFNYDHSSNAYACEPKVVNHGNYIFSDEKCESSEMRETVECLLNSDELIIATNQSMVIEDDINTYYTSNNIVKGIPSSIINKITYYIEYLQYYAQCLLFIIIM